MDSRVAVAGSSEKLLGVAPNRWRQALPRAMPKPLEDALAQAIRALLFLLRHLSATQSLRRFRARACSRSSGRLRAGFIGSPGLRVLQQTLRRPLLQKSARSFPLQELVSGPAHVTPCALQALNDLPGEGTISVLPATGNVPRSARKFAFGRAKIRQSGARALLLRALHLCLPLSYKLDFAAERSLRARHRLEVQPVATFRRPTPRRLQRLESLMTALQRPGNIYALHVLSHGTTVFATECRLGARRLRVGSDARKIRKIRPQLRRALRERFAEIGGGIRCRCLLKSGLDGVDASVVLSRQLLELSR
jgi:hypothetical protein